MDQGQKITLVEMESKLQNDNNGSYRRQLRDQLAHYKSMIYQLVPSASEKTHFEVLESLKTAIQHAETILTHW